MFDEEKEIYGHYLEELRGKRGRELSSAATEFARNGDALLIHRRAEAANAEAIVLDRLGSALDMLELQIAVQIGLGQTIIECALPEAGDDDDFLEIDHTLQVMIERLDLGLPLGKLGEVVLDISALVDLDSLVELLAALAIDDLVLQASLTRDSFANLGSLGDLRSKSGHQILQIG